MAKIYLRLILVGERDLDSVPDRWRSEVELLLTAAPSE